MRRRRPAGAPESAAAVVALWNRAQAEAVEAGLRGEAARLYVRGVLAIHGADMVGVIRARRALRGR